jgi:hypothetical protein
MARQKAWTKTDADTRKGVSSAPEFAPDTKRSPQPPNTTPGTPNGDVNGGIKSGHWAAQKPATLGLGVTRAPRRRPVSRASQIAGG